LLERHLRSLERVKTTLRIKERQLRGTVPVMGVRKKGNRVSYTNGRSLQRKKMREVLYSAGGLKRERLQKRMHKGQAEKKILILRVPERSQAEAMNRFYQNGRKEREQDKLRRV